MNKRVLSTGCIHASLVEPRPLGSPAAVYDLNAKTYQIKLSRSAGGGESRSALAGGDEKVFLQPSTQ